MYNGFNVNGSSPQPGMNGGQDEFLRRLIAFLRDSGYTSLDGLLQQLLGGVPPGGGLDNGGGNNGGGFTGGGGFCLCGDVPVRMADGSVKPASEIRVHDLVLGYDPGIGNVPQEVFTTNSAAQTCKEVVFEGGSIRCSSTHNWFVEVDGQRQVVSTLGLVPDMQLITEDQTFVSVQHIGDAGHQVVYWWNCVPNQCYYAGGVLHHNASGPFSNGVVQVTKDGPVPWTGLTTRKEQTSGVETGGGS